MEGITSLNKACVYIMVVDAEKFVLNKALRFVVRWCPAWLLLRWWLLGKKREREVVCARVAERFLGKQSAVRLGFRP